MRLLIAGGGTGGHLYPGIALAREVMRRDPSAQIVFVGTATGVEATVVPREGFPLELIRVTGLKGKSRLQLVKGFLVLPMAAIDAWRLVSRYRPDGRHWRRRLRLGSGADAGVAARLPNDAAGAKRVAGHY